MPKPFTDEFLLRYSGEMVTYEVERFFWLAEVLSDPSTIPWPPSKKDQLRLHHTLIEAFVLHLRNLIEFLYPKNPRDTDIIAEQFCAQGVWEQERGTITQTLYDARERAHKEVAHLTEERKFGYPPEKEWPVKNLADEIKPLIQLLDHKAQPSRLSPKVVAAVDVKPEKTNGEKLMTIGPKASPGSQWSRPVNTTGPSAPTFEEDDVPIGRKR
jgi:hypothetical protein